MTQPTLTRRQRQAHVVVMDAARQLVAHAIPEPDPPMMLRYVQRGDLRELAEALESYDELGSKRD